MIWISNSWPGCKGKPSCFSSAPQPPPWHELRIASRWSKRGLKWKATSPPCALVNKLNSKREALLFDRPLTYKTRPRLSLNKCLSVSSSVVDETYRETCWSELALPRTQQSNSSNNRSQDECWPLRSATVDRADWSLGRFAPALS